ncbi:MAG TPA: ATP-binding protein [bacterium]|nr:ATP-binding protein [bacterium]
MKLSIRRKIALGFGGALAALFLVGALSVVSIIRLRDATLWVEHSLQVIESAQKVTINLRKALVQYRGYLLTRDAAYLKNYQGQVRVTLDGLNGVKKLVADNSNQTENLVRVEALVWDRLANIQEGLKACARGGFKWAFDDSNSMPNLKLTQRLDEAVQTMVVSERGLLEDRKRAEESSTRIVLAGLVASGGAALLICALAFRMVLRETDKRAEFQKMLMRNEHRLFQFLEAVPLGILIMDKDKKPYYLNRKGKELLGRSVGGAAAGSTAQFLQAYKQGTGELYPEDQLAIVRAWKGESTSIEDVEVHRPDGTVMPLQVWGTPLRDPNGEILYAMSVFGDITERKQIEEMKYSLISIVSHQLKTPVAEINGYIENLVEGLAGPLNARQRDYLMDMREIGMDNFRLISDLLSLSKIERGLMAVNLETLEVADLARMALRDYEKTIHRKELSLSLEGVPRGLFVTADRDKLVETIRNLVSNALKFTDRGGISLSARVQGDRVELDVADTGTGMSDAAMAQLFSPKRVLGTEASRAGAGLGLYVAKNFMKAQKGDIWVKSEKGKGSVFTLSLPRAEGLP